MRTSAEPRIGACWQPMRRYDDGLPALICQQEGRAATRDESNDKTARNDSDPQYTDPGIPDLPGHNADRADPRPDCYTAGDCLDRDGADPDRPFARLALQCRGDHTCYQPRDGAQRYPYLPAAELLPLDLYPGGLSGGTALTDMVADYFWRHDRRHCCGRQPQSRRV